MRYLIIAFMLVCGVAWGCSACDKWAKDNGGKPPKQVYSEGYDLGYKTYKNTHSDEWKVFDCGWTAGEKQAKKDMKR